MIGRKIKGKRKKLRVKYPITCPSCKYLIRDKIFLIMLGSSTYNIGVDHIGTGLEHLVYPPVLGHAVGFKCPSCYKAFPSKMHRKIRKYLRFRHTMSVLTKEDKDL